MRKQAITHLHLDSPQILAHFVEPRVVAPYARRFLFLFDANGGFGAGEVGAVELSEEGEDFVVGKQGRAWIYDLVMWFIRKMSPGERGRA